MKKQVEFKPIVPTPPTLKPRSSAAAQVWADFCRRLEQCGDLMFSMEGLDEQPALEAETLRYLIRELRGQLEWQVEHADPALPHFWRADEPGSGPTGPNVDNWYLMARVRGGESYKVTLDARDIFDFLIGVLDQNWRNCGDYSRADFQTNANGEVDITFSDILKGTNCVPLPRDAALLMLRVYYHDWSSDRPPQPRIERIGGELDRAALPTVDTLERQLKNVSANLQSAPYAYPLWQLRAIDEVPANTFPPPLDIPGGGGPINYGFARYRLQQDEALIVEFKRPRARYWGLHTYTLPWFSQIDVSNRVTSLNDLQLHVDRDDYVRVVVAHDDPGVQNWLDTGGFTTGSVAYRWIWS
ncbi:MAG: hypothetical protein ABW034_02035, partial [Steroidobacteraceae bacterium]